MALSYRTPAEEVLNRFTSEEQSRVSSNAVLQLSNLEKNISQFFNFKTCEKSKERLSKSGIYLSPFAFQSHSHPNCKMLENHLLYTVIPSFVDNSFYFVGIKSSKLNFLKKRHSDLSLVTAINRFVTSKDTTRYPSDFVVLSSSEIQGLHDKLEQENMASITTLLPRALTLKARNLILHDELHYWSLKEVSTFLGVLRPQTVIATLVIPPEILAGSKESLNPWCYTYSIDKDIITFRPDGVSTESYRQPLRSCAWLKIAKFTACNGEIYSVDLLESKFAHHVISLTKCDLKVDDRREFSGFDAISLKDLSKLTNSASSCYPISFSTVSKLYRYLRTLKKPDEQSNMAKLSQIIENPTGREIKFAEDFGKLVLSTVSIEKIFCKSMSKHVVAFIVGLLPNAVAKLSSTYRNISLGQFVENLEPFKFSIKTISTSGDYILDLRFTDFNDYVESTNPEDVFERLWGIDVQPLTSARLEMKYVGVCDSVNFTVNYPRESASRLIKSVLIKNFCNETHSTLSGKVICEIATLFKKSFWGSLIYNEFRFEIFFNAKEKVDAIMQRNKLIIFDVRYLGRIFKWFFSLKRFNMKYILFCESKSQISISTQIKWSKVTELKGLTKLKKTQLLLRTCYGIVDNGFSQSFFSEGLTNGVCIPSGETQDCKLSQPLLDTPEVESPTVVEKQPKIDSIPTALDSFLSFVPNSSAISCKCGTNLSINSFHFDTDKLISKVTFKDRLKGRSASFFSRDGFGYSYNGGSHASNDWMGELDNLVTACGFETQKFNQCLIQKYSKGSSIGMHSDNEQCYEADHEVLTVNLIGTCTFKVSCQSGNGQEFIDSGKFFLMPKGFQVSHKHSVTDCSEGRISATFRLSKSREVDDKNTINGMKFKIAADIPKEDVLKLIAEVNSMGRTNLKMSLCDCVTDSYTGKLNDLKNLITTILRIEGFSDMDSVLVLTSSADHKSFDFNQEGLAICLYGILKVAEKGAAEFLLLGESEGKTFKEANLEKLGEMNLAFIAYKPKLNSVGILIEHKVDCNFSGFTETLFGTTIKICPGFEPDSYQEFEVPADGDCFWHSVSHLTGVDGLIMKEICKRSHFVEENPELKRQLKKGVWAEREAIALCCKVHSLNLKIFHFREEVVWEFGEESAALSGILFNRNWHFQPCMPRNGCVVRAIAKALGRRELEVLAIIGRPENKVLYKEIQSGKGLNLFEIEHAFEIFGIHAFVECEGKMLEMNNGGKLTSNFRINGEHIEFLDKSGKKTFSPAATGILTVSRSALEILNASGSSISYVPSLDRAHLLAKSFFEASTGVFCSNLYGGKENLLDGKDLNLQERKIGLILGTFGSGKSYVFKQFIYANAGKATTFVSPRRNLADAVRDEIIGKVGRKGKSSHLWNVKTFETFLLSVEKMKLGHVLIIDEIQLFPPGYLDLVLLLMPSGVNIYVAGDPCQSNYDNESDRMIFEGIPSDIDNLLNGKSYRYNVESRRFLNPIFKNRLPCRFHKDSMRMEVDQYQIFDSIEHYASSGEIDEVVLVAGFEEKKIVKAHLGQKFRVLTFGESTGLTFNKGAILITYDSMLTDEKRWITALSRFRLNLSFINSTQMSIEDVSVQFHGRSLWKFLTERASESDIFDALPGKPDFFEGFNVKIGKDEGIKEDKLLGDPWLKTEIFLGQEEDMEIEEMEQEFAKKEWFKTHVPIFSIDSIRAKWVHRIMLKEFREVRCGEETTQQFSDEHSKNNGKIITNAAERFETIYPRHKGNDSITFLMAVKKRLSFSRPDVESAKLRRALPFGKFLLDEFLKLVPLNRRHDHKFMEKAVLDFEKKKTSKSAATIENHSGRSSSDWLADVAMIFMKSQHCTKFDNRFRDAKAGQTLACFQHSVLCRFAPYMRYIEMKLLEVLPKNFYIHSGKGLDELNAWVKEQGFSDICTESDYEAFDASQDHYILAFEISVMKYLAIPNDLIDDYVYIKTHLGSKLGNFSIMRFTGEASTFLFNTMANMLFTFLRYDLNGSESICFAGDDMCSNRRLRIKKKHEGFLNKLKLKAKVQFTSNPTFCGWCLCPKGIFKKPQLVLERLHVALETGNLHNCMDNYAIEVGFGYQLGEELKEYMSEEDLENHYCCVRFIVKHRNLLKSSVSNLFGETNDPKQN